MIMRTLLLDNYDSYTYNLFHLIAQACGVEPVVLANDAPELAEVDLSAFDALVISPGPGRPQVAGDVGLVPRLVVESGLPVLGVCLGHQLLGWLAGAEVGQAARPVHGMVDRITHVGRDLFAGLPQWFAAVRYHSLRIAEPLPDSLEGLAWSEDGVLMGVRHRERPWWGVQFHPESIGTEHGTMLLRNFAELTGSRVVRRTSGVSRPRSPAARRELRVLTRRLDREAPADATFTRLFGEEPYAFWLDSSRIVPGTSRYSYLGAPGPDGEVLRYRAGSGAVDVLRGGVWSTEAGQDVFAALDRRLRSAGVRRVRGMPGQFAGGYVGYLGYEADAEAGAVSTPDAVWMSAGRFVVIDHVRRETWLAAVCPDDDASAAEWLRDAGDEVADLRPLDEPETVAGCAAEPWLTRSRTQYLADIAECQRQLRRGESYEICLTTSVEVPFHGDPLRTYRRLRAVNPAPYAAFLRLDGVAVLSSSPERFLTVDRRGVAESRPIKGTAARVADPVQDEVVRELLRLDPKTRAENLMIVDLLRNDLGSVCEVGSVSVPRFLHVETYATLHQLVTTIRGRLRSDVTAVQAARACFPGGSMTGAPKRRSMEIIDRLERRPRGVYSGALGYFGYGGEADLSIVIRTAVVADGTLTVGAGGAIVLDSDPVAEYDEMILKARSSLRALDPRDVAADEPRTA